MRVIEQRQLGFFMGVHQAQDEVRVVVDGELDLVTAPLLESGLDRVAAGNVQPTVLLDLSRVGFVDAAGWRVVDNAARMLEGRGRRLIVAEVSEPVRRFVQVVGDYRADLASDGADGSGS